MSLNDGIRELARRLRTKPRITVVTGAGVSAASGIPTFRGPGGLWRSHRPEELATPEAFAKDPLLVWEWYAWRRELVARARPNRAHEVLAAWSRREPGLPLACGPALPAAGGRPSLAGFTLITQNVDGLHERAGTENVIRFHGSLWELGCWDQCESAPRRWRDETPVFRELPPRCQHCGGLARPGVVWFGEPIPPDVLAASRRATACDVFLTVGTSSVVYPAASLVEQAAERGAYTVEINPEATPASAASDLVLPAPAEEALDRVERLLQEDLRA